MNEDRKKQIARYIQQTEVSIEDDALLRSPASPLAGQPGAPSAEERAALEAAFPVTSELFETRRMGRNAGTYDAEEPAPEDAIACTLDGGLPDLPSDYNAVELWDEEVAPHVFRAIEAAFKAGIPLLVHAVVGAVDGEDSATAYTPRAHCPRGSKENAYHMAMRIAAQDPAETLRALKFYQQEKKAIAKLQARLAEDAAGEHEDAEPPTGAIN